MSDTVIYLDYNATTPLDRRVLEEMMPFFTEKFGNAASNQHVFGWDAEEAVDIARERVAKLINAKPNEIIFTSGATESISMALFGLMEAYPQKRHIITCATEHKAVLDGCQELEKRGVKVSYLQVDNQGQIDLNQLSESITHQTLLIALMHANNEIGVLHPIEKISAIAKRNGVLLMTDATQSVGKIPFDASIVDLAVCSAHKMYGPKGVGALFINRKSKFEMRPRTFGGGHERGYRSGTLNVPGIVGFGKACALAEEEMDSDGFRLASLRDNMEAELSQIEGIQFNSSGHRLPHMTNVSFQGIEGSKLMRSMKGLAISQGSACTSNVVAPSHVLKSLGLSDRLALSSVRIGLGRFSKEEEIRRAAAIMKNAVESLRLQFQ